MSGAKRMVTGLLRFFEEQVFHSENLNSEA
jgi:hypothetical protein